MKKEVKPERGDSDMEVDQLDESESEVKEIDPPSKRQMKAPLSTAISIKTVKKESKPPAREGNRIPKAIGTVFDIDVDVDDNGNKTHDVAATKAQRETTSRMGKVREPEERSKPTSIQAESTKFEKKKKKGKARGRRQPEVIEIESSEAGDRDPSSVVPTPESTQTIGPNLQPLPVEEVTADALVSTSSSKHRKRKRKEKEREIEDSRQVLPTESPSRPLGRAGSGGAGVVRWRAMVGLPSRSFNLFSGRPHLLSVLSKSMSHVNVRDVTSKGMKKQKRIDEKKQEMGAGEEDTPAESKKRKRKRRDTQEEDERGEQHQPTDGQGTNEAPRKKRKKEAAKEALNDAESASCSPRDVMQEKGKGRESDFSGGGVRWKMQPVTTRRKFG